MSDRPYEVFISFKNMKPDCTIAREIYDDLTERGIKTFFSPVSIDKKIVQEGGIFWNEPKDKALYEANTLVLVGTHLESVLAPQVYEEWHDNFYESMLDGDKAPNSRLIPYIDMSQLQKDRDSSAKPWRFPKVLWSMQCKDMASCKVSELCEFVAAAFASSEPEKSEYTAPQTVTRPPRRRSDAAAFSGRGKDLRFLEDFCRSDAPQGDANVSWTIVRGKAGMGKSRLARELCDSMRDADGDWIVYQPQRASEFLANIEEAEQNVLVCFDDCAGTDFAIIKEIIGSALESKRTHKTRFILLERPDEPQDDFLQEERISKCHYQRGDLDLEPLSDDDMKSLVRSYITARKAAGVGTEREFTEDVADGIVRALGSSMYRPLYAILVADQWLNGEPPKRANAVRGAARRRLEEISKTAEKYARSEKEKETYGQSIRTIAAFATLLERTPCDDFLRLVEGCTDIPQKDVEGILEDSRMNLGGIIKGIEPDLVGEYACVETIDRMTEESARGFFDRLFGFSTQSFQTAVSYVGRIYHDYEDQITNHVQWKSVTTLHVPLNCGYIKSGIFRGCGFIREVVLHDRVSKVSRNAFQGCAHLQRFTIPAGLEIIDSGAFADCPELTTVTSVEGGRVPSLLTVGVAAFRNCTKLKTVQLPESVSQIQHDAFSGCKSLEEFVMPDSTSAVTPNVFAACFSLRKVVLSPHAAKLTIQEEAFSNCIALEEVANSERIQSIGENAFENCESLRSIAVPQLRSLDKSAFRKCNSLETIDLSGASISRILPSVFEGCKNLEQVVLPEGLKEIGASAFRNCEKLREIHLPASVTRIDDRAFSGCKALAVDSFGDELQRFRNFYFCAFTVSHVDDELIRFVTSYLDSAEVILPQSIQGIGDRAFKGDRKLTRIEFHQGVSRIGEEAFANCTNLQTVAGTFSGLKATVQHSGFDEYANRNKPTAIPSIGAAAFRGCKKLKNIPGDGKTSAIADSTFEGCAELQKVSFGRSPVRSIGKRAFFHCGKLDIVEYDWERCHRVSAQAFCGCPAKFSVRGNRYTRHNGEDAVSYQVSGFIFKTFSDRERRFVQEYDGSFGITDVYKNGGRIRIPYSCIGFFENPFEGLDTVLDINVPDTVHHLIDANFQNTPGLRIITLPPTILEAQKGRFQIPPRAFAGCPSLRHVNIRTKLHTRGEETETWWQVDHESYPALPPRIGKQAFSGCSALSGVTLSDDTKRIAPGTFTGCTALRSITVPGGATAIGAEAFSGCTALETMELPSSLKTLGKRVFKDCEALLEVKGLADTSLSRIPDDTFNGCKQLSQITLPDGLSLIGERAFCDCRQLKEISLMGMRGERIDGQPTVPPRIGAEAFKNCHALRECTLPQTLQRIENSTFESCRTLTTMALPKGIEEIGTSAFRKCHRLSLLDLGYEKDLRIIGENAFDGCHLLTEMSLPSGVSELSNAMFKDCFNLERIRIRAAITAIPPECFKNCQRLTTIEGDTSQIASVGVNSFYGCAALTDLSFLSHVSKLRKAAFRRCSGVTEMEFDRIEEIPEGAFMECSALTAISFPVLKAVAAYAFYGCPQLQRVPIGNIQKSIGGSAFSGCTKLAACPFAPTLSRIEAAAFRGCEAIRQVEFPPSVITVEPETFRDATNLSKVSLPAVTLVCAEAFEGCTELDTVDYKANNVLVDRKAFAGCKELKYIYFMRGGDVVAESTAFDGINAQASQRLHDSPSVKWVKAEQLTQLIADRSDRMRQATLEATALFLRDLTDGMRRAAEATAAAVKAGAPAGRVGQIQGRITGPATRLIGALARECADPGQ